jgi:hypothetical protein
LAGIKGLRGRLLVARGFRANYSGPSPVRSNSRTCWRSAPLKR